MNPDRHTRSGISVGNHFMKQQCLSLIRVNAFTVAWLAFLMASVSSAENLFVRSGRWHACAFAPIHSCVRVCYARYFKQIPVTQAFVSHHHIAKWSRKTKQWNRSAEQAVEQKYTLICHYSHCTRVTVVQKTVALELKIGGLRVHARADMIHTTLNLKEHAVTVKSAAVMVTTSTPLRSTIREWRSRWVLVSGF